MPNSIRIDSVNDVRIAGRDWAGISCTDHRGVATDIMIATKDVASIAPQLLCCAAAEAAEGPKPILGTIVPGCLLPVMDWRTGHSNVNGEPILIVDLPAGVTLQFQFSAIGARACGNALAEEGKRAAPPPEEKPS